MSPTDVNILIHGLFFMTFNATTGNLEIFAPKITDHHFVGGVRGSRVELPGGDVDLTGAGLHRGAPNFPGHDPSKIPNDIKGSILQFTRKETGVGDFSTDPTKFAGRIILPWPQEFHAMRCDDRTSTFKVNPASVVGQRIEDNCNGKGSSMAGVVTCLRYKVDDPTKLPWPPGSNPLFYLQPCKGHDTTGVNADLQEAQKCFTAPPNFDLQLLPVIINPTPTGQNRCHDDPPGGTLIPDDELSLEEENKKGAPDIRSICGPPVFPGISPANCPTFYVG